MCRRYLFDREIVQLLKNKLPSESEDDLESGDSSLNLGNQIIQETMSAPLEEALSVDEQLCSTKAPYFLKQYLQMKLHKWEYKFFVLCGVSGFSYNFEMYSGQENNDVNSYSWEPEFGASGNVVVRLCRTIPKNMNYKERFAEIA
ncbi:PiggyBac transposable element-derived protein [Cinara cedri]|uniref:PiggyBac transposable element-derived protein n=1 Tax=Cinara cedri TaxID=506608 RepID=A0A5E4NQ04_9HEMI|nr:PiggyBac transposable element-derived protein [Cinara cedri]